MSLNDDLIVEELPDWAFEPANEQLIRVAQHLGESEVMSYDHASQFVTVGIEALTKALLRLEKAESEITRLRHDTATGLLTRQAFEPIVAEILRKKIRTLAARAVIADGGYFELPMELLSQLFVLFKITDMDGLGLANQLLGHKEGDRMLNALGAQFQARAHTTQRVTGFRMTDDANITEVQHPTRVFCRWGGDEFAGVFTDMHPNDVAQLVNGAIEGFERKEFRLPIPHSANEGYATLPEILEAAYLWRTHVEKFEDDEALLTFVKLCMMDVADQRMKMKKMRARLWSLVHLYVRDRTLYNQWAGMLLKGGSLTNNLDATRYVNFICRALVAAWRNNIPVDQKTAADLAIERAVRHGRDQKMAPLAHEARKLRSIDGKGAARDLLWCYVAEYRANEWAAQLGPRLVIAG